MLHWGIMIRKSKRDEGKTNSGHPNKKKKCPDWGFGPTGIKSFAFSAPRPTCMKRGNSHINGVRDRSGNSHVLCTTESRQRPETNFSGLVGYLRPCD